MVHSRTLAIVVRHLIRAATVVLLSGSLLVLAGLGVGPRTGRYQTLTVLSGSMRPTIPPGSVVVVTPTALRDVRVGDVITYQIPVDDHRVVTHRVAQIVEPGDHPVVRTRGDANSSPDPWVARLESAPAWRVRASMPGLGYAIQALRRPQIARVLRGLVPLLLALVWLGDIWAPDRPSEGSGASTEALSTAGL